MATFTLPDGTTLEVMDGTLIDGHPELRPPSPDAERPQFIPIRPFHTPTEVKDNPRTLGPQPSANKAASGYSNPVDDPEFTKKYWSRTP